MIIRTLLILVFLLSLTMGSDISTQGNIPNNDTSIYNYSDSIFVGANTSTIHPIESDSYTANIINSLVQTTVQYGMDIVKIVMSYGIVTGYNNPEINYRSILFFFMLYIIIVTLIPATKEIVGIFYVVIILLKKAYMNIIKGLSKIIRRRQR